MIWFNGECTMHTHSCMTTSLWHQTYVLRNGYPHIYMYKHYYVFLHLLYTWLQHCTTLITPHFSASYTSVIVYTHVYTCTVHTCIKQIDQLFTLSFLHITVFSTVYMYRLFIILYMYLWWVVCDWRLVARYGNVPLLVPRIKSLSTWVSNHNVASLIRTQPHSIKHCQHFILEIISYMTIMCVDLHMHRDCRVQCQ